MKIKDQKISNLIKRSFLALAFIAPFMLPNQSHAARPCWAYCEDTGLKDLDDYGNIINLYAWQSDDCSPGQYCKVNNPEGLNCDENHTGYSLSGTCFYLLRDRNGVDVEFDADLAELLFNMLTDY